MQLSDFTNFDKMLTPVIVQVIFWIGVIASVLLGLIMFFGSLSRPFGSGLGAVMGLLYMVVGPILTRVYCEVLIIVFKIHENLVDIKHSLRERQPELPEIPS